MQIPHMAVLTTAGAVGCLVLCVLLGMGQGVTLYTLSKFAERYNAHTYSLLVRLLSLAQHVAWRLHDKPGSRLQICWLMHVCTGAMRRASNANRGFS